MTALDHFASIKPKNAEPTDFVFPGSSKAGHLVGLPKMWERTAKRAKLKGVTLHGLRHWFASAATELGYSDLIIGALLGHAKKGNFAFNRTSALSRFAKMSDVDYALMLDADSVIVCDSGFGHCSFKAGLCHDYYLLKAVLGSTSWCLPLLTRNGLGCQYVGVLHEYLKVPDGASHDLLKGLVNIHLQDSSRNQNPKKYLDDAQLLASTLKDEDDPFLRARYTFYLAQSLRDAGDLNGALVHYRARAALGFWEQEVYIALINIAGLLEELGAPNGEVLEAYALAYEACPSRAEALHGAARFCRKIGRNHCGYLFSKQAIRIDPPEDGLFVEDWIYRYGALDELAVLASHLGYHEEAIAAIAKIMLYERIPATKLERIRRNANYSAEMLVSGSASGSMNELASAS